MESKTHIFNNLSDLGFNFLESEVYLELLAGESDFADQARSILQNQKFFFNSKIPRLELLFKLYSRTQ